MSTASGGDPFIAGAVARYMQKVEAQQAKAKAQASARRKAEEMRKFHEAERKYANACAEAHKKAEVEHAAAVKREFLASLLERREPREIPKPKVVMPPRPTPPK